MDSFIINMEGILTIIISSAIIQIAIAMTAVKAMNVKLEYMEKALLEQASRTRRAHERIDELQREMLKVLTQVEMIFRQIHVSIRSDDE